MQRGHTAENVQTIVMLCHHEDRFPVWLGHLWMLRSTCLDIHKRSKLHCLEVSLPSGPRSLPKRRPGDKCWLPFSAHGEMKTPRTSHFPKLHAGTVCSDDQARSFPELWEQMELPSIADSIDIADDTTPDCQTSLWRHGTDSPVLSPLVSSVPNPLLE